MNYIYKLNITTVKDEENLEHATYGIEAYTQNSDQPIRVIPDIFLIRSEAERFIDACNILELDIDHLDDVVHDVVNA